MKSKKLFYLECNLAGRQYHDADEVWDELKIGTLLELRRDPENRYDENAVAVMYNRKSEEGEDDEEFILGYIPRDYNLTIAQLLEMGWTNIFECRISRITPDAHYENQIRMIIRIVRNNK